MLFYIILCITCWRLRLYLLSKNNRLFQIVDYVEEMFMRFLLSFLLSFFLTFLLSFFLSYFVCFFFLFVSSFLTFFLLFYLPLLRSFLLSFSLTILPYFYLSIHPSLNSSFFSSVNWLQAIDRFRFRLSCCKWDGVLTVDMVRTQEKLINLFIYLCIFYLF